MTTKTPHKHAALIKQWADGAGIEFYDVVLQRWVTALAPSWDEDTAYRIKFETITIGKYEVPAPMRVAPEYGTTYYIASIVANPSNFVNSNEWDGGCIDRNLLAASNCWHTSEDAELASKALIELLTGGDK